MDFIDAMKVIFSRMSEKPSEQKQTERIYRNLRKEFHSILRDFMKSDLNTFTRQAVEADNALLSIQK